MAPTATTTHDVRGGGVVRLVDDADLDAFVRRLAALCEDPAERAALREGPSRFRLADPRPAADPARTPPWTPPPPQSSSRLVERGAVTERVISRAAADGVTLRLGRGAVLTPLARDRARVLGVDIERER